MDLCANTIAADNYDKRMTANEMRYETFIAEVRDDLFAEYEELEIRFHEMQLKYDYDTTNFIDFLREEH